jgi:prephenate dehydrogenase
VAEDELAILGPGLQDTTRLALSSYALWRDIIATNAGAIDRAVGLHSKAGSYIRQNLRTRLLQQEFERAARLAERLRRSD